MPGAHKWRRRGSTRFVILRPPGRSRQARSLPADQVHREVTTAMKEAGIDLSSARPQLLTEELVRSADLLVTMGCEETCPVVPGLEREDWPLADPKGQSLEAVRAIRDEIQRRVTAMLAERGLGRK